MILLDETKNMVEGLYKNGATNNEQLLELLTNLKMIAESTELDLNEGDDFQIFFSKYLTSLATKWIHTNQSTAMGRKELVIKDIEVKLVACKEASSKLHDSIINEWNKEIQLECLLENQAINVQSLMDLKVRIENSDL